MRTQRCRWTGKFKRRGRTGLLLHQGKYRKLQPCSDAFSAMEALGARLMYMTSKPCSKLTRRRRRLLIVISV